MSRPYRLPGTYETPFWRFIKYLLIALLIGIPIGFVMAVIAYETDWYIQLGIATWNFHYAHPWFFLIYGVFGSVSLFVYRRGRHKRKEQEKRRKFLEEHGLRVET